MIPAWSRCTAAILGIAVTGASSSLSAADARGAARPAVTVVRPSLPPVSLQAWARANGYQATWVERDKRLRLKNGTNELEFEVDRREVSINGLRVFLGDAPSLADKALQISPLDRDRLLLPILAPQGLAPRAPVRVIALDPGHGGRDKGTSNGPLKLLEKDLTLDVARRLRPLLEARGFKVVLTRNDDSYVDLAERPARAAAAGADLFLSIHFNAGPASVQGIETYALVPQYQYSTSSDKWTADDNTAVPGNAWDGWNVHLAYTMHRTLRGDLGRFDRGLKRARFVVIRDLAACPGMLIECGYLSNDAEAKLISTPAWRDQIAAAIAHGIESYNATLVRLERERSGRAVGAGGPMTARPATTPPTRPSAVR